VAVGPTAADPPVFPAALTPIDLRPTPVAATPPAADTAAAAPPGPTEVTATPAAGPAARAQCGCRSAPAADASADARERGRPACLWWRGLSWCLALICAERALSARSAEEVPVKLRRRWCRRGP
jgi:hypothetical protein